MLSAFFIRSDICSFDCVIFVVDVCDYDADVHDGGGGGGCHRHLGMYSSCQWKPRGGSVGHPQHPSPVFLGYVLLDRTLRNTPAAIGLRSLCLFFFRHLVHSHSFICCFILCVLLFLLAANCFFFQIMSFVVCSFLQAASYCSEEVVLLDPSSAPAHTRLADCYYSMGEYMNCLVDSCVVTLFFFFVFFFPHVWIHTYRWIDEHDSSSQALLFVLGDADRATQSSRTVWPHCCLLCYCCTRCCQGRQ